MRRLWGTCLLMLATGACAGGELIAPPPDRLQAGPDELAPELPPTIVDLPLLVDLSTAVALMEKELPRRLGNIDQRIPAPGNDRGAFAFEIRRSPFDVTIEEGTIRIAATIHYQGRGWYNPPIGPEVGGSCGTSGLQPRARAVISFRPELDREWRLVTRPRLSWLGPLTRTERDQCEVTFLKIDVTDKVLSAARSALRGQLPKLAAELRKLDVRSEVEKIWAEIQKPIALTDSVWLLLQPEGVRLGQLSGGTDMLGGTIGIRARPMIRTGPRPDAAPVALPDLEAGTDDAGLNLLVEGRFDYDLIGANLTGLLKGTTVTVPGGILEVREIAVFGIGGGRLALGVRFGGTGSGLIYFVGTPHYELATGRITVPDLEYDASTASLLIKGMAWLKADEIREFLRTRATFPSGETMDRLSTLAMEGMNRELIPGVFLTASLKETALVRLAPRTDALYLQAHATGHAALVVTDSFFVHITAPGRHSTPPAGPR